MNVGGYQSPKTNNNSDSQYVKPSGFFSPARIPTVRSFNVSCIFPPRPGSSWNFGFAMTEMGQRKQRLVPKAAETVGHDWTMYDD